MKKLLDVNVEFATSKQVGYARGLEKQLLPKYKRTSKTRLERMSKQGMVNYLTYLISQKEALDEMKKEFA